MGRVTVKRDWRAIMSVQRGAADAGKEIALEASVATREDINHTRSTLTMIITPLFAAGAEPSIGKLGRFRLCLVSLNVFPYSSAIKAPSQFYVV